MRLHRNQLTKGAKVLYEGNLATIIEPRLNTVVIECYDKKIVTTIHQLKKYEKSNDNG